MDLRTWNFTVDSHVALDTFTRKLLVTSNVETAPIELAWVGVTGQRT